jgi:hypothetical protein
MSTRALQVIIFPEGELVPRLVPLEFKLEPKDGHIGVFPCTLKSGEVERVLANGRADPPSLLGCEYHMIAPRLAGIDSDQLYCAYPYT